MEALGKGAEWKGLGEKNVYLIGFMGSGKSLVGRKLAERMGREFIDMDEEIEKIEGMKIKEIFTRKGEEYFRMQEEKLLEELGRLKGRVISTGGGVVMRERNWKILKKGVTVYLEISEEEAIKRLKDVKDRPILERGKREEIIKTLLPIRRPYYEKADIKVKAEGKKVEEIVEEILSKLANFKNEGNYN